MTKIVLFPKLLQFRKFRKKFLLETFLSMFYSLVLLIETINTYVICIWGYISFNSRNIDKKKKQMAEAEVAEAEAG